MLGSSSARIRQILIITCLTIVFLLSVIIMGLVGVNGIVTFQNFQRGCLLYMSVDGNVATFNNGFCLFPIVGSAVVALVSLLLLIYWIMMFLRKDEYAPTSMSVVLLSFCTACGMLSFAICGEIGIGLNKGCQILGDQNQHCRSKRNFNALYGAEVSAGLMGGFWLLAMLLELFQLKSRPRLLGLGSVDQFQSTTVVPNTRHSQVSSSNSNPYNSGNVHGKSPVVATTTTRVQKEEYVQQPEMTSYPAHGGHYQQQYQPPQQQQQYYQVPDQQYQQPYQPPPVTQTAQTTTQVVDTLPSNGSGVVGTDYR